MGMTHTEAICGKCGETFNPTGEEDDAEHPEHYVQQDGTECGGQGRITGTWTTDRSELDGYGTDRIPGGWGGEEKF